MSQQDDKLETLIQAFQGITPTPEQTLKWYLAVERKRNRRRNLYRVAMSLAAGLVVGIIIGGSLWKMTLNEPQEEFSATDAMVSVKNLAGN